MIYLLSPLNFHIIYSLFQREIKFLLFANDQIWPVILYDQAIRPGDSSQLIPDIRERLKKLRYQLADSASTVLDEELVTQLKVFQEDWGLNPDPVNALGRVKFMFPNSYNVYIHDTPSKGSFAREKRDMSSGCVRVENPFELAVLLLSDSPEWSPLKIRMAMQQDKEQIVRLKSPVDVVLIYLTAWTDGRVRIQFRKDVYQKDEKVMAALNQKPEATKAHPF